MTPRQGTARAAAYRPPDDPAGTDESAESEHREPLADARIRPLLERYVAAAGGRLEDIDDGLSELHVPDEDRDAFGKRERVRIAFTLDALERDPDAEIAVIGSALVEQLIAAIRSRGSRVSHGFIAPESAPNDEPAELTVPVTNGMAATPRVATERHAVVRLLARVVVRAGSSVEEHLIESRHFDAATGIVVPDDVASRCTGAVRGRSAMKDGSDGPGRRALVAASRSAAELVSLALADLRTGFEPKVTRLREEAHAALQIELKRIDGYYTSLLEGLGRRSSGAPDAASGRAYEAEHARRRAEEERRHQVHVVVHPVQITEWELLVQQAQWDITATGHEETRGRLVAERWLNGAGEWALACPSCGAASPHSFSVCKSGHVACDTCASTCGVCAEVFCEDHGISACHVDGHPVCDAHGRTCASCREPYCSAHEGICADGDHAVCATCIEPCALCGRTVCDTHATMTKDTAPRGCRRLCAECVRLCEGGSSESVGRDEVTRCSSCERDVCETHRAVCAVDQRVHCSKHMRRSDGSRRLVCSEHLVECVFEPGAMLASDEVGPCASCGRAACDQHSHPCIEDGKRFCNEHLLMLRDKHGKYACMQHAATCHVDRGAYLIVDMVTCPVCGRATCKKHVRSCQSCGRTVCFHDIAGKKSRCATCSRLTATTAPSDAVIDAAVAVLGSRPTPKQWKTARDATHTVVELDLGWKRRVVFTVRHDDNVASGGRAHSITGSRPVVVPR
jgi:hypothetical protein